MRKKLSQLILNIEKDVIEKKLKKKVGSRRYLLEIKGKIITIWESNQDIEALRDLFRDVQPTSISGISDDVAKLEMEIPSD